MYTEIRNPPKGQQHRKEWPVTERWRSDKNPRDCYTQQSALEREAKPEEPPVMQETV